MLQCRGVQSPSIYGKYEKMTKKNYKNPHPGLAPETTRKKHRKIRKSPEHVHFRSFFRFFSFHSPKGVGDFVMFWYFFRISGLEEFCTLREPHGIANVAASFDFPRKQ